MPAEESLVADGFAMSPIARVFQGVIDWLYDITHPVLKKNLIYDEVSGKVIGVMGSTDRTVFRRALHCFTKAPRKIRTRLSKVKRNDSVEDLPAQRFDTAKVLRTKRGRGGWSRKIKEAVRELSKWAGMREKGDHFLFAVDPWTLDPTSLLHEVLAALCPAMEQVTTDDDIPVIVIAKCGTMELSISSGTSLASPVCLSSIAMFLTVPSIHKGFPYMNARPPSPPPRRTDASSDSQLLELAPPSQLRRSPLLAKTDGLVLPPTSSRCSTIDLSCPPQSAPIAPTSLESFLAAAPSILPPPLPPRRAPVPTPTTLAIPLHVAALTHSISLDILASSTSIPFGLAFISRTPFDRFSVSSSTLSFPHDTSNLLHGIFAACAVDSSATVHDDEIDEIAQDPEGTKLVQDSFGGGVGEIDVGSG
ncbi:hypothetical protein M427DRAFT_257089 [Gonapodya prolifera JEL478]|uniref:Uncharacterized protein n=1 Tax=Gonapodya prolifera (strain JEL478) TaxID=1344416 RepID=A0A138ZXA1_GONPJ|nr:hypothetical protein M427DRAFT_257089 [Gonapodya prolifera JEL478]|eukprot:KXS09084.1 hypothetical protein M427DRAFT_257089 [Gonapodya prolifera JEL478]